MVSMFRRRALPLAAALMLGSPAFSSAGRIDTGVSASVAMLDSEQDAAGFSVVGSIHIWAPASHIVSSSRLADSALCWLSGASMAAPHVARTAALLFGGFPNASPSAVEKAIKRTRLPDG
jgi:subtilisin family serine protease